MHVGDWITTAGLSETVGCPSISGLRLRAADRSGNVSRPQRSAAQ